MLTISWRVSRPIVVDCLPQGISFRPVHYWGTMLFTWFMLSLTAEGDFDGVPIGSIWTMRPRTTRKRRWVHQARQSRLIAAAILFTRRRPNNFFPFGPVRQALRHMQGRCKWNFLTAENKLTTPFEMIHCNPCLQTGCRDENKPLSPMVVISDCLNNSIQSKSFYSPGVWIIMQRLTFQTNMGQVSETLERPDEW
jgi:hypothetical protein